MSNDRVEEVVRRLHEEWTMGIPLRGPSIAVIRHAVLAGLELARDMACSECEPVIRAAGLRQGAKAERAAVVSIRAALLDARKALMSADQLHQEVRGGSSEEFYAAILNIDAAMHKEPR